MTIAESQIITLIELKKKNSAIEEVRSLLPCEHMTDSAVILIYLHVGKSESLKSYFAA